MNAGFFVGDEFVRSLGQGRRAAVLEIVSCLSVGAYCAVGACGAGAAYPDKPVRFIVPFTPGGTNDILRRIVGEKGRES